MAKGCFTGFLLIFMVVLAAAQMTVPKGAEAKKWCSELIETGTTGTCDAAKCKSGCTSKHEKDEHHANCVHDESGPGVSCQCYWWCKN
ncbi:hypothetical protein SAY86_025720 [Trapa natans]|uniref:Uncharacterized protein n=1 Tax=Trapa natans TaxID=22666 RepID=A0AAN7QGU4_TRANT|nr:hypothetical protein SAY86_025720 [Trapa natans]